MTSQKKRSFWIEAAPLLLVLFLDGMGLGLVIPILSTLLEPSSHFLVSAFAIKYHDFFFGIVIGIFMLCWFLGAAILGDLSDQIGRKKSLLICLKGAGLGNLLSAIGVSIQSFTLMLIGRVIAGLTSGSQPIAQAAIIDLSEPHEKAKNIGLILTAVSLGFIFGPLIGGLLSNNRIFSWASLSTPFYFAALLSFLNAVLLYFLYHETFTQAAPVNIKLQRAWDVFVSAFRHPVIRKLSFVFLIFILGWSSFFSFISSFLIKKYQFSAFGTSLFMAWMGVGFAIGNGFLVSYFAKRYPLNYNVIVSFLLGALLIYLFVPLNAVAWPWIIVPFLAATIAVGYSHIVTLFSNQVDHTQQGWVMGITGSIMALVWGITSILVGLVVYVGINISIYIAVVCFILSAVLLRVLLKNEELHLVIHPE